ncbi:MAG: AmmeMemoRadiSam system radical SAM enzyme [Kiritimatiellaeota bacterium]|nr:AmmeMemoRadiSam system radical SAM enzyme [Kiritimatiellota bacterium]
MWRQAAESFAVGLSLGPACFLSCGLFHGVFLSRHARPERRPGLELALFLLLGRLVAYLGFGFLIGILAMTRIWTPQPWILFTVLGVLMAVYAALPPGSAQVCPSTGRHWHHLLAGAFALGLLTGASPCPPFLAAVLIALRSHGMGGAVLTFLAFFVGTSIYLVPVWLLPAALTPRLRRHLQRVSRLLAAAVAAYALTTAWRTYSGPPLPGPRPPASGPGISAVGPGPGPRREASQPATGKTATVRPAADRGEPDLPPPAGKDVVPLFKKPAPTRRFTESILRRLDLSLHEAQYWSPMGEGIVQCQLCPTLCILDKGEQGMCRARVNIGGKLRTIVYSRPVAVHIDPIEKKPLFHVLPGSRVFSIATASCNLGCVFCQNYEISQAAPEEVPHYRMPPEKVVALAIQNKCQGIAYTYTEATTFFEYMRDTARLARKKGLRNYWVTCGWIQEKPLLELCSVLDAASVGLKGFSDEFYVKYCNAHLFPVLRTLEILRREQVEFEIINLIIPGANDDPAMIRAMCKWIVRKLGRDTPLHFTRFHPDYKLTKRPPTPLATLKQARRIAREEGLRYVYVGNVLEPGLSNTVCPQCGKVLIRRAGFTVLSNNVENGRCKFCGARIPGIWTPLEPTPRPTPKKP